MEKTVRPASNRWPNWAIAAACLSFFGGMVGMSYASVPLYKLFCQVTGYGGTTQRVEQASDVILEKTLKVRFDANVSGGLPWEFAPVEREITLKIGETRQIAYTARNTFNAPTRGKATFNVTPEYAGSFFNKIACFCFTDTELKPGESLDMPVVFYIDPEIVNQPELKNLTTITLSYTFFPSSDDKPVALAPVQGQTTLKANTKLGG
ncbi:MAG: cytochrome c oxidase assembly protein [Rhizobiaceae bacterium]